MYAILVVALSFKAAVASETLQQFFQKQYVITPNLGGLSVVMLTWLDGSNHIIPRDAPLDIIQEVGMTGELSLIAGYSSNENPTIVDLSIMNGNQQKPSSMDITLSTAKCIFIQMNQKCKVTFTANKNAPISGLNLPKEQQRIIYVQQSADSMVPVQIYTKSLRIHGYTDGGSVDGVGLNKVPNKLLGVAVSPNYEQDKVPLTLRIHASKNILFAQLFYKIKDGNLASLTQSSCVITSINSQGDGECFAGYVIPKKHGVAQITLNGSMYFPKSGILPIKYKAEQLSDIVVNIGTLFASYSDTSGILEDDIVYGAGIRYHLEDYLKESGVLNGNISMGMDDINHKLYIADGNSIFKLSDIDSDTPRLTSFPQVLDGANLGAFNAQTLTLTNEAGMVIVGGDSGADYHNIWWACEDASLNQSMCGHYEVAKSSINNSMLGSTNNAYIVGSNYSGENILIIYNPYFKGNSLIKSTINFPKEKQPNSAKLAIGDNGDIYAAINDQKNNSDLLFLSSNNDFAIVNVDNTPFHAGYNSISFLQFFGNILYAGDVSGNLYSFSESKWQKITQLPTGPIADVVKDANNNWYIASATAPGHIYKLDNNGQLNELSGYTLEEKYLINSIALSSN